MDASKDVPIVKTLSSRVSVSELPKPVALRIISFALTPNEISASEFWSQIDATTSPIDPLPPGVCSMTVILNLVSISEPGPKVLYDCIMPVVEPRNSQSHVRRSTSSILFEAVNAAAAAEELSSPLSTIDTPDSSSMVAASMTEVGWMPPHVWSQALEVASAGVQVTAVNFFFHDGSKLSFEKS